MISGVLMHNNWNVAVVGASGAVGEALISILEERGFPIGELYPLAGSRSAGRAWSLKAGTFESMSLPVSISPAPRSPFSR